MIAALEEVEGDRLIKLQPDTGLDEIEADDLEWALAEWMLHLDAFRAEAKASLPGDAPKTEQPTDWLIYFPGRSLSTGEAEVASRGFFDVLDRPPSVLWVATTHRRGRRSEDPLEFAVIAWVPDPWRERAEAGMFACPNQSLDWLSRAAPALHAQLVAHMESEAC